MNSISVRLFPQLLNPPCWLLLRKKTLKIEMTAMHHMDENLTFFEGEGC
jgi:hypothetical protein